MSLGSFLFRLASGSVSAVRGIGVDAPAGVVGECDIAYGPYDENVLDVYAPARTNAELPLLVSVHGGGWVYGDKEVYKVYCARLAEYGFVVVNFSYRLAPEHKWPAQLEDTCAAFAWALAHAKDYGADPKRLVAVGDSAGAQILATYCCCCSDPELADLFDVVPPKGGLPRAVGLNCGCFSSAVKGSMKLVARDILPDGGTPQELEAFSPLENVDESFPPAQLVSATRDFMRKDSEAFDKRLEELGVQHELIIRTPQDGQPLTHVFHLDMKSPLAARTNGEQCAFLLDFV